MAGVAADPRNTVCQRCWNDIFSTQAYQDLCSSDSHNVEVRFAVDLEQIKASAAEGCSWCDMILDFAQHSTSPFPRVADGALKDDGPGNERWPRGKNRFFLWFFDKNPINRMNPLTHQNFHLNFFRTKSSHGSTSVTAWDVVSDVDSEPSWKHVFDLLSSCSTTHPCPSLKSVLLPRKLIDVSPKHSQVTARLVVTSGLYGQYAALSYCWGGLQQGTTTQDNLRGRLVSIDEKSLSRTVQDAIIATRKIGLRYLWVDAICIVQDSEQEKVADLQHMSKYYQNAYVTIVAANASSSDQGFLEQRKRPTTASHIPFWSDDKSLTMVSVRECTAFWGKSAKRQPVDQRCWTLQERLLSSRMLVYKDDTAHYRCGQGTINLGNSLYDQRTDPLGNLQQASTIFVHRLGDLYTLKEPRHLFNWWTDIVNEYSSRCLTNKNDKLVALAALAAELHERLNVPYAAGLWVCGSFPVFLLWRLVDRAWVAHAKYGGYLKESAVAQSLAENPDRDTEIKRLSGDYIAPSWSWASVPGAVDCRLGRSVGGVHLPDCRLEDVHVELQQQDLPFGAIRSARAHVTGRMCRIRAVNDETPLSDEQRAELSSKPDSRDLKRADYTPWVRVELDDSTDWDCVPLDCSALIIRQPGTLSNHGNTVDGLVLSETGVPGEFRRVGIFIGKDAGRFPTMEYFTITLV